MAYGWNATAYQLVNPGIERWFSSRGDAVVGYVQCKGYRVVAGSPVCSADRLDEILTEWEADCAANGQRICYFGAAGRIESLLAQRGGHSKVVLGSQPVWKPQHWQGILRSHASLRAQLSRANNKGVDVREWSAEKATNNPELRRCLCEWLSSRGLPPLHFLVEPETLSLLADRRVFVAERDGHAVGFVVLCPVSTRKGWLTEQFIRGDSAPNGTIELLLDNAVATVAAEGADYLTMGLVPLSSHGAEGQDGPPWLRLFLKWVRAHGNRFYNFRGLEAFKAKLLPEAWEPIYAISKEPQFSMRSLYAIAAAFTEGAPVASVMKGLSRAVRQELRWLVTR